MPPEADNDTPDPAAPGTDPAPSDELGEAGKKALTNERQARREADRQAKAALQERDDALARLAELEEANSTEQEKAVKAAAAAAAKAAREEVAGEYRARILHSEVLAAAAGKLTNPADAVAMLDLDTFDVDDAALRDSLSAAIDKLLDEKPYLAGKAKPGGSADGGAKPPAPVDEDLLPAERLRRGYANTGT